MDSVWLSRVPSRMAERQLSDQRRSRTTKGTP